MLAALPLALPLFLVLRLNVAVAVGLVVLGLVLVHRYSPGKLARVFRESISWNVLFAVVAVLFFKEMLVASKAVGVLTPLLTSAHFPLLGLFFALPFLVGMLGAGVVSGLIGLVFGIPSIRVKGFYLAITTIAAQFIIVRWVIPHWGLTGGSAGLVAPPASIFGFVFTSEMSKYYLVLAVAALTILFAKNLARTRVGRAFIAVRDNDLAAEVMGGNLLYYKLLAFFIGCFMAGIAGSLLAHWTGSISTEKFTFTNSILYVGMIIIGGVGTTLGPILGVVFIRFLDVGVTKLSPTLQSAFPALPSGFTTGIAPMLFGLAIILFLIFEPRGLAHRWALLKAAYRLWPFSY